MVRVLVVACVALAVSARAGAAGFDWKIATPESQGMSAEKVEQWRKGLAERNTKALLLVRHGCIVCEWYAEDFGADKTHYTASMAKALVGGMSLAVALEDGRLKLDDPASKYIPQWRDDPRKSKITILHLATHSSGVEDAEQDDIPHNKLPGWKGAFWKQQPDPFTISRDQAPIVFEPGTDYAYSNPGMAMLSYAITAAVKGSRHEDVRSLLRERIMRPIGVEDREWSIGYGKTFEVDGLKLVPNWGGGGYTARAVARVGRLMLRRGDWEGKRILDGRTIETCTSHAGTPIPKRTAEDPLPATAPGWRTNHAGAWKGVPRDAFCGAGAGNQMLVVIPSLDLIVVRMGGNIDKTFWGGVERLLLNPLMEAIVDPPYRPSGVIKVVRFGPVDSISRQAIGSDNWPITWGDDDHQYTSYGDGWGFAPRVEGKLSLGLARIEGPASAFKGINVRSASAEKAGDGPAGAKASGMLMLDGVLCMWVRNVGNSQLAWSADRGRTWEWGFRLDESFGCPTFLNFGCDYAGARDGYVYIYSQDGPGAYVPYDGIVMARARKEKVKDRDAYEFFSGLDDGVPGWSKDIERRRTVFQYPGHCERLDVVYNAGLKRYLMTVGYGHGRGWGIFDAPEPWGPWTTAFHTPDWGLGETHGYRLPTKWISPDGRTMHLVFSGRNAYDAFCVRSMEVGLYDRR